MRKRGKIVRKNWLFLLTTLLVLVLLAGCGKSLEEQIETGMTNVQASIEAEPVDANKEIGRIKVFLPSGYTIEESEDETNYLLKKNQHQFILFVNPNEQKNSKLLYDLFKKNQAKEIVEEQSFETKDVFGFAAILQDDEDSYELIVSSGGVKITTLSNGKQIDQMLQEMMQIAHSVSF